MQSWHRCLSLLLCLPATAMALQPLITDDTGTQGAGGKQVELSYARSTEKEAGAKTVSTLLPLVHTYGWTDTLDVYISGSHARFSPSTPDDTRTGAGNPVAGFKWRFFENETSGLSLALKSELRFPVSDRAEDRGLGNAKTNAGAALLLSRETGFGAIHANLVVSSQRFGLAANQAANRDKLWRLSVAPVIDLNERWRIALDTGLVTNPHRAEKPRMGYIEAGIIYAPDKDIEFAAGIIRDVRHQVHQVYSFTGGVTWRFR